MSVVETEEFLGTAHAPPDDPNYFTFVFPLRAIRNNGQSGFEVCLMHRASGRAGGDWISTVGGHIRNGIQPFSLDYILSEGARELREEMGNQARLIVHRGRIEWQNDEQGSCRGEVLVATGLHEDSSYDDYEGVLRWFPIESALANPEVHPMIRRVLENITSDPTFYEDAIPTEVSMWTRKL